MPGCPVPSGAVHATPAAGDVVELSATSDRTANDGGEQCDARAHKEGIDSAEARPKGWRKHGGAIKIQKQDEDEAQPDAAAARRPVGVRPIFKPPVQAMAFDLD